jgi:outer membrane protein TolC
MNAAYAAVVAAPLTVLISPAAAQRPDTVQLTLQQAVTRALATSEDVETARQQRAQAAAQITQARAGALPQISGAVVYNRTLASIFDNIQFGEPEPGEDPPPNPFANLPFGRPNTWNASLQIAQPLYAAGRVSTALQIARRVRDYHGAAGAGGRGRRRAAGTQRVFPGRSG